MEQEHAQTSKTIMRTVFALIGFGAMFLIAVGIPDDLLLSSAQARMPFGQVGIPFLDVLMLGPFVLAALILYLHIHVAHWLDLEELVPNARAPFMLNMRHRTPRWVSAFVLYWFEPAILALLAWKGSIRSDAWVTTAVFFGVTISLIWLQVRRCRGNHRSNFVTALSLVLLLVVGGATYEVNIWLAGDVSLFRVYRKIDFTGAKLSGLDLRSLVLREVSLRYAQMVGADLRSVDLAKANLSGADLTGALLEDANLSSAMLKGAKLDNAVLNRADLWQADLRNSSLRGAELNMANLYEADLANTDLRKAILTSADLRNAHGLTCPQLRSAIGWQQAYRSAQLACKAPIPKPRKTP